MSTETTLIQTGLTWDTHDGEHYILAPYTGERTREIAKVFSGLRRGEGAAYAQLFAISPELLDAARFALSVLKVNPVELSEQMAIEKLEAAIAKAEPR